MGHAPTIDRGAEVGRLGKAGFGLMVAGVFVVIAASGAIFFDLATAAFGVALLPLACGALVLALGVILLLWDDARAWSQRVRSRTFE